MTFKAKTTGLSFGSILVGLVHHPTSVLVDALGNPITDENPLPVEAVFPDPLPVEITTPLESNGAVPVNIQDQTSLAIDLKFIQSQAQTTLTSTAAIGATVINVASAASFDAGDAVGLFCAVDGHFMFAEVISVNVLAITIDTPIDKAFASGDNVIVATGHMNLSGTLASPQVFQVGPAGIGTGLAIDITRIMGNISDGSAMDDGKFGGITGLTNGVVLRQNNGEINNIWNVKSNGDIGLLCFDAQYTTKAPAGENGFRFRNTYASPGKHGVAIRLEAGDTLEILIQDDLTDLTDFQVMAQGHVVTE